MHIAFVHFLPRRIEDPDAAHGWFDGFRKSNLDFVGRRLNRAAYGWLRVFKKSVRFDSRYASQHNQKQNQKPAFHFVPPKSERPTLCGKMSSRKKCNCAITPTLLPVRSLIGMIASTPT